MQKRLIGLRIEELLLLCLLTMDVLGFVGLLPGDLEYFDKIIGLTGLAIIFYRVSLTKIFYGERNSTVDLVLVIAYVSLILKTFIEIVKPLAGESATVMNNLYVFIASNEYFILLWAFFFGSILLVLVSLWASSFAVVRSPSILALMHEQGPPSKKPHVLLIRFISSFFVLNAFYIIVANLIAEWITLVIDDQLTIVIILFYFVSIRHIRKLQPEAMLFKIQSGIEDFLDNFLNLFYDRSRIFFGVSGLLVLHLLTDVAVFVLPSLKFYNVFYLEHMGANPDIVSLLLGDMSIASTLLHKIGLITLYLFNVVAILLLLISPAVIWYFVFTTHKKEVVPRPVISAYLSSLIPFYFAPVFHIGMLTQQYIRGVNIYTTNIALGFEQVMTLVMATVASFCMFLLLSHWISVKKFFEFIILIATSIFFGRYMYYYFTDVSSYYISIIQHYATTNFFLSAQFLVFFAITVVFYVFGTVIFYIEVEKEFDFIKGI